MKSRLEEHGKKHCKYPWGTVWGGIEQVHNILDLLPGLKAVGSTDPVADAAAVHDSPVLREAVAKFWLDQMVYPIAVSLDRHFWLMRVRRPMEWTEIETWLLRRGFRFAKTAEDFSYLKSTGFEERLFNFGALDVGANRCHVHRLVDGEVNSAAYGEAKISHHEFSGHFDAFLAFREPDFASGDIAPLYEGMIFPVPDYGYCSYCGSSVSGWTRECSRHGGGVNVKTY